jgi:hypothetical protein
MRAMGSFDPAARERYLAGLPAAFAGGVTAADLPAPPPDAGLGHELRDDRLTLTFDPPGDAVALCRTWAIERPVAISPDVHQRSWIVHEAGESLPDPYGPRIASSAPTAGPYRVTIELDGRPAGPLPGVSAGASPAYDLVERGGRVVGVVISLRSRIHRRTSTAGW